MRNKRRIMAGDWMMICRVEKTCFTDIPCILGFEEHRIMSTSLVKSAIQHHNRTQLEYYDQKIKKTMLPSNSYYVRRHIREFLAFSNVRPDEKLLEVGCGMGKFTLHLLENRFDVTGLDLSPFLLQKLLEYNDNRFPAKLICSDILDAPEECNGKFDKVIGFFTLHHFHHLETYFQAMARTLKPGGEIIFLEPNAFNPLYYFQILFSPTMTWQGDKGVAKMTKSNFRKAAEYAGLEELEIKKYGFLPPFAVNRPFGKAVDLALGKLKVFEPLSAFQLVRLRKPM